MLYNWINEECVQKPINVTQKQYCKCEGLVCNFGVVYIVSSEPSDCGEVMNLMVRVRMRRKRRVAN